ncbi:MAG: hypothetical protein K6T57_00025 [Thermaceae bacterium]|nr:hypothetical protein [Thermaceae bacterium]
MKKQILAGVPGGIAMFVASALTHMVLPLVRIPHLLHARLDGRPDHQLRCSRLGAGRIGEEPPHLKRARLFVLLDSATEV